MKSYDTWALPIVKRRLLAGEHIDQQSMLRQTDGRAWRLGAAIYYLRRHGWDIQSYTRMDRTTAYYLPHAEIQRLLAA